jgi:hypothetical protein
MPAGQKQFDTDIQKPDASGKRRPIGHARKKFPRGYCAAFLTALTRVSISAMVVAGLMITMRKNRCSPMVVEDR